MTSEPWAMDTEKRPPLPQDDFNEVVLTAELEPAADGGRRALLYPGDCDGAARSTEWLAVDEELLLDLADVR